LVRLCSSLDGFNGVAEERPGELAEAKSFEPLRDVVRHGTSLRQAGFAEAVQQVLKVFLAFGWQIFLDE
jgi:hypothetical protein